MDFKLILESWQEKKFQLSILDSQCIFDKQVGKETLNILPI